MTRSPDDTLPEALELDTLEAFEALRSVQRFELMEIAIFVPIYWVGLVAVSYIVTKIWRWSGGSVFLAIWFHAMVNYVGGYALSRDLWTVADRSNAELAALQTGIFVLTALIVALIGRTKLAKSLGASR